jgi:hypothetical protein
MGMAGENSLPGHRTRKESYFWIVTAAAMACLVVLFTV